MNEILDKYEMEAAPEVPFYLSLRIVSVIGQTVPDGARPIGYISLGRIQAFLEMPESQFDLMLGFLRQNGGCFSNRAREKEFSALTDEEVLAIEVIYADLLLPNS